MRKRNFRNVMFRRENSTGDQVLFYNSRKGHYPEEAFKECEVYGNGTQVFFVLRDIKYDYAHNMEKCHRLAKEYYFSFCNKDRGISVITIRYKRKLPVRDDEAEYCVNGRFEKLEKLPYNQQPNTLEIITDAGDHAFISLDVPMTQTFTIHISCITAQSTRTTLINTYNLWI